MAHLSKLDNRYVGSIQCGAGRDAYLQLELSDEACSELQVLPVPWLSSEDDGSVEPESIRKAVVSAQKSILTKYNRTFNVKKVWYLPTTQFTMIFTHELLT